MFRKSRIKIIIYVMAMLVLILAGTVVIIYFTTYHELNTENRQMLELYAQQYAEYGMPGSENDNGEGLPSDIPENAGEGEAGGGSETESGTDSVSNKYADEDENPPEGTAGDGSVADTGADVPSGEYSSEDESSAAGGGSENDMSENMPEHSDQSAAFNEDMASPEDLEAATERRKYMVSTFYSVAFSSDGSILEINNETESGMSDEALGALAKTILDNSKEFGTEADVVFLITETESFTLVTMMDNTILGETIESLVRYTIIFGAVAIIVLFFVSLLISKWIIKPLEYTYKKQKQFISDAGHELKTPISTIETNAELLSRETGENQWLSNIRYENGRMGALVKELLDLARLESTKAEHTQLDFSSLVLAGVLPFEGIAFEQGLTLEYDIAPSVIINGSGPQLEELVSILVDNALSHTKPNGRIKIYLGLNRSNAVLTVANEGDAIAPEERELIFERFYRSDASRTNSDDESAYGDIAAADSDDDADCVDFAAETADSYNNRSPVHDSYTSCDTSSGLNAETACPTAFLRDAAGRADEESAYSAAPSAHAVEEKHIFSGKTTHYGLGLSIARATVTAHGGKISVDCKNGFTEFKAVIPVK